MAIQLGFGVAPDAKSAAEQFIGMLQQQVTGALKLSEALTNVNDQGQIVSQTFKAVSDAGEKVIVTLKQQNQNWELVSAKVDEATASLKAMEAQQKAIDAANRRNAANQAESMLGGLVNRPDQTSNQVNAMEVALRRVRAQIESGAVSLQRFQEIYNALSNNPKQLLPNLTQEESALSISLRNIITGFKESGRQGADAGQKIFISWEGVLRLFEAQVIKRISGFLQSAFAEGVSSASQFSIKIAEIETISQKAGVTTSQWTNGIRELSSLFGNSQADVAEAAYQAISNQVVKGAEAFDFMATALKFARATVSSAADSVNLLSSALQSFQLSNSEAERASATFFKTIELGRVRAKDLADTFGRVGPSAAQMGLSLEEVGAAIATLTTTGVKPAEALTLINNLILKLSRPTEEMKKLFEEWGVASGQAAVQAFGFAGVLQRLDVEAQKGGNRLGDLLGQIRAIRGTIGLTGSAFGTFTQNFADISKGKEEFDRAAAIVGESFGKRLEVQLNKVKVFFAEDFGDSIVRTSVRMAESAGGLDNVLSKLVTVLKTAITAVGIYQAGIVANIVVTEAWAIATGTTATAMTGLLGTLGKFSAVFAVFQVSKTIGDYLFGNDLLEKKDQLEAINKTLERTAILRQQIATQDPQRQNDRDTGKEITDRYETLYRAVGSYYAKQGTLINQARELAVQNLKETTERTKAAATGFLGSITQQLQLIKDAASQAKTMIRESLKASEDAPRKTGQAIFDARLKYANEGRLDAGSGLVIDDQKIALIKGKIEEVTNLARRKFQEGTKESTDEARKLFSDVEKLNTELFDQETSKRRREYDELVRRGGVMPTRMEFDPVTNQLKPIFEFKVKTLDLEQRTNSVLQERLRWEEQVRKNAQAALDIANAQELKEKERLKTIQNALNAIEKMGATGELGKEFKDDPRKALTEFDRQAAIIKDQAARKDLDVQIGAAKFLAEQRRALEQEVQVELTKQQLEGEQNRTTLQLKATQERLTKIKDEIAQAAQQMTSEVVRITKGLSQSEVDFPTLLERKLSKDTPAIEQYLARAQEYKKIAQEATDAFNKDSTAENLEKAKKALTAYTEEARKLLALKQDKNVLELDPKDEAVQRIREIELATERLDDAFKSRTAARDNMQAANTAANELGAKIGSLPDIFKVFGDTAVKSSQPVVDSLERVNLKTIEMIQNMDALIQRIDRLSSKPFQLPDLPPQAEGNFFGANPKYMKDGGFVGFVPRGSDTRPAMIGKEEMVMNSYASKEFLPVLQAMNAGSFRSQSNSQTVNVGDITVNVQGGTNEVNTLRNIGKGLRRGIRRGTISLT